jgi:hypothetical protein
VARLHLALEELDNDHAAAAAGTGRQDRLCRHLVRYVMSYDPLVIGLI